MLKPEPGGGLTIGFGEGKSSAAGLTEDPESDRSRCGPEIDLLGVSVKLSTEFVSLLFTPLDDQPLAPSKHVLMTALARDKQTGTVYKGGTGRSWRMSAPGRYYGNRSRHPSASMGTKPSQIRALDCQGEPKGNGIAIGEDGTFAIDDTSTGYYYELKR